jgi:toxin-antitoxin system PIN domain toxin
LAWPNHVHHALVKEWFHANHSAGWRTCPITQSAFIRISSNPRIIEEAATPVEARLFLRKMTDHPSHSFIPDDVDLSMQEDIPFALFHGYRQVTDFYLSLLARQNGCRLATLDGKLLQAARSTSLEDHIFYISYHV